MLRFDATAQYRGDERAKPPYTVIKTMAPYICKIADYAASRNITVCTEEDKLAVLRCKPTCKDARIKQVAKGKEKVTATSTTMNVSQLKTKLTPLKMRCQVVGYFLYSFTAVFLVLSA